jgi:LmbE family N-acetylglucosaminyl deacetylase
MTEQEMFYAPQRALVIVPHADDIEFGAAGTIARWTEHGTEVTYCIVTDSASGSNAADADLAELVERRKREQRQAAEVLGVGDVRFLDYRDGILQPTIDLRRDLTRIIREVRPQLVLTMDPTTMITAGRDYINHPDHRAAGESALYATFPSAETRPIFPELLDEGLEPHKVNHLYLMLTDHADLFIDVESTYERKVEALRCHGSQLNDDVIEMIRQWDSERGQQHGKRYAEAFRTLYFED